MSQPSTRDAIAKLLHLKLSAARNLPYEDGDVCADCLESAEKEFLPILATSGQPSTQSLRDILTRIKNRYEEDDTGAFDAQHSPLAWAMWRDALEGLNQPVALESVLGERQPEVTEMYLCEVSRVILHPNQLYRFGVAEGCEACAQYLNPAPAAPTERLRELAERIADDAETKILFHIDEMYPDMWKGVAKSARTSIRNMILNQAPFWAKLLAASEAQQAERIAKLEVHELLMKDERGVTWHRYIREEDILALFRLAAGQGTSRASRQ